MKKFRADLHIHTVLSPCGDLEMSPDVIINKAKEMHLEIIGITDHNSTRECSVIKQLGVLNGIMVLAGAEVTTKEEAHCLTFFETDEQLNDFQEFLDNNLPDIKNDVNRFGYQVAVDIDNNIIFTEERLLISALNKSIDEIEMKVHSLNGLFIPAHIDKKRFSVIEQLGFLPPDLRVDALEISPFVRKNEFLNLHKELFNYEFISGSDAHYPDQIGKRVTLFEMENIGFEEIRQILHEKRPGKIEILN
ncbi:MAG: PHP-associated domain-containing protein [Bacteroidales bacterium]|nr:PHP-associated domain-containing protein [Bacteroidales bacterium]